LAKTNEPARDLGKRQVHGVVVRVFRTDGRLNAGDRVEFPLWVCRRGDQPTGEVFIFEDAFSRAEYFEAYLTGIPPKCGIAAYEFCVIDAPSDRPVLMPYELEQPGLPQVAAPAKEMSKRRRWQFWKRTSDDDGWEVWRRRSDDQVIAAMRRLEDYTDEGQVIVRAEMRRRGLAIPPHSAIHIYRVKNPAGGMMDVASVLPSEVVFGRGLAIEAVVGRFLKSVEDDGSLSPEYFDANPLFADFLHDVVARHCPSDPELIEEAKSHLGGKVYVIDRRSSTPDGSVPAADIIGSFDVDQGVVVTGSYQRNPNHTVFSEMGFFRLTPQLHERLAAELGLCEVRTASRPGTPLQQ
jgi:hypothetical protein